MLAVMPAWGDPGRGVYVNGRVHKVTTSTGSVRIDIGVPVNNQYFTPDTSLSSQAYRVCRTYSANPSEGLAVLNDKIFLAYVADQTNSVDDSCGAAVSSQYMRVYIATYDLVQQRWTSNHGVGSVPVKFGKSSGSGAAITVFNNQLYLFTDSGFYSSGNGSNWAKFNEPGFDVQFEPLDAVTIYPPNEKPRMLIITGRQTVAGSTYQELWANSWNGNFDETQPDSYYLFGPLLGAGQQPTGRVALLPGTAQGTNAWGAAELAVQLFVQVLGSGTTSNPWLGLRHLEFTYGPSTPHGSWREEPVSYPAGTNAIEVGDFLVYTSYFNECFYPSFANQDLRQVLHIDWEQVDTHFTTSQKFLNWMSDALVPQNERDKFSSCGVFNGQMTDTVGGVSSANQAMRKYWSLVGVVLGSPPFGKNNYKTEPPLGQFSNLEYESTTSNGVQHSLDWTTDSVLSAGLEVKEGFGDIGVRSSFDFTYKHGVESSKENENVVTVGFTKTMGTEGSTEAQAGKFGWALFLVPRVLVQDFAAYAWTWDADAGTGTYLSQDLNFIDIARETGDLSLEAISFPLDDPAGISITDPYDPFFKYKDMLKGMGPFPLSTEVDGWTNPAWNWADDGRWTTPFPTPSFNNDPAMVTSMHVTSAATNVIGGGETSSVDIRAGFSVEAETMFGGFSASLSASYGTTFKTSVKTTTGVETSVKASIGMKTCEEPAVGCVNSILIQPYFLKPSDYQPETRAPWIPDLYKDQRPWCITWKVLNADIVRAAPTSPPLGSSGAAAPHVAFSPHLVEAISGEAPPPRHGSGRIVSGNVAGEAGGPYSHYSLSGGNLTWVNANGGETRIPMTADQFTPSIGVSIEINGLSWSSVGAKGSWHRAGDAWTFQSDPSVQQTRVVLRLDFGSATFDLNIQQGDMQGLVPAGVRITKLGIVVNQLYAFYSTLKHDIDLTWQASKPAPDADSIHVTSFAGRYDSATQHGKLEIAGTLPANLPEFGDIGFDVNEHSIAVRLLTMDGFLQAYQSGGVFRYSKEGLIVVIDFGRKTWAATFNENAFNDLLVPRLGSIRARVLVGGRPWSRATDSAVLDYSVNLMLVR
jgi:hypothetical protein